MLQFLCEQLCYDNSYRSLVDIQEDNNGGRCMSYKFLHMPLDISISACYNVVTKVQLTI